MRTKNEILQDFFYKKWPTPGRLISINTGSLLHTVTWFIRFVFSFLLSVPVHIFFFAYDLPIPTKLKWLLSAILLVLLICLAALKLYQELWKSELDAADYSKHLAGLKNSK